MAQKQTDGHGTVTLLAHPMLRPSLQRFYSFRVLSTGKMGVT
jgi:hypothetical protein